MTWVEGILDILYVIHEEGLGVLDSTRDLVALSEHEGVRGIHEGRLVVLADEMVFFLTLALPLARDCGEARLLAHGGFPDTWLAIFSEIMRIGHNGVNGLFEMGCLFLLLALLTVHFLKRVHDHSEDQVQQEERPKHHEEAEVNGGHHRDHGVLVVVHHGGPPLQSNHLEDSQHGSHDIIEVSDPEVNILVHGDLVHTKSQSVIIGVTAG